jgi:hypothetical protein
MWNFLKKKNKTEDEPLARRPFTYDEKVDNLVALYSEVDNLLFEKRTEKSKKKKYY